MSDSQKSITGGAFSRFASMLLLAVPAVAAWHPSTASGGLANLLVFWSWLYVPSGLLINLICFLIVMNSDDVTMLKKVRVAAGRKYRRAALFALGATWMFGAVYRGWMATGCLLAAGWIAGPVLMMLVFEGAKSRLEELPDDDTSAPS